MKLSPTINYFQRVWWIWDLTVKICLEGQKPNPHTRVRYSPLQGPNPSQVVYSILLESERFLDGGNRHFCLALCEHGTQFALIILGHFNPLALGGIPPTCALSSTWLIPGVPLHLSLSGTLSCNHWLHLFPWILSSVSLIKVCQAPEHMQCSDSHRAPHCSFYISLGPNPHRPERLKYIASIV